MRKALFIDRDGVINHMVKYDYGWDSPQKIKDISLVEGVVEIIRWANMNHHVVVEVSNQPGVAKGKMTQKMSSSIEAEVHRLLRQKGAEIDHVYICPHHPEGVVPLLTVDCDCRKPKPGLLLKAAEVLDIDLKNSIFLGDKATDAQAGVTAGCWTILYIHNEDERRKLVEAHKAVANLISTEMKEIGQKIRKWLN